MHKKNHFKTNKQANTYTMMYTFEEKKEEEINIHINDIISNNQ